MTLGAHRKYHHDILNALFAPDFRLQKARLRFKVRDEKSPELPSVSIRPRGSDPLSAWGFCGLTKVMLNFERLIRERSRMER